MSVSLFYEAVGMVGSLRRVILVAVVLALDGQQPERATTTNCEWHGLEDNLIVAVSGEKCKTAPIHRRRHRPRKIETTNVNTLKTMMVPLIPMEKVW